MTMKDALMDEGLDFPAVLQNASSRLPHDATEARAQFERICRTDPGTPQHAKCVIGFLRETTRYRDAFLAVASSLVDHGSESGRALARLYLSDHLEMWDRHDWTCAEMTSWFELATHCFERVPASVSNVLIPAGFRRTLKPTVWHGFLDQCRPSKIVLAAQWMLRPPDQYFLSRPGWDGRCWTTEHRLLHLAAADPPEFLADAVRRGLLEWLRRCCWTTFQWRPEVLGAHSAKAVATLRQPLGISTDYLRTLIRVYPNAARPLVQTLNREIVSSDDPLASPELQAELTQHIPLSRLSKAMECWAADVWPDDRIEALTKVSLPQKERRTIMAELLRRREWTMLWEEIDEAANGEVQRPPDAQLILFCPVEYAADAMRLGTLLRPEALRPILRWLIVGRARDDLLLAYHRRQGEPATVPISAALVDYSLQYARIAAFRLPATWAPSLLDLREPYEGVRAPATAPASHDSSSRSHPAGDDS